MVSRLLFIEQRTTNNEYRITNIDALETSFTHLKCETQSNSHNFIKIHHKHPKII
jgi:hypothetical protein